MSHIALVDTCVFLNVLDVPGFNQSRQAIIGELAGIIQAQSTNLLLPFAAMLETGNHIAHVSDGRLRRKYAKFFVEQVQSALAGDAPWTPTQTVDLSDWNQWLSEYPDRAAQEIGLGDLSIIKEWEAACARHPTYRVRIWTIDGHLSAYDRPATVVGRRR